MKADSGAKLAYTTDTSAPKCATALGKNEHAITITSTDAGKTLILKAVSCRDTSVSVVVRKEVRIPKAGEAPRQEVGIPSGFDSAGTQKKDWKDSVSITISVKSSTVFWNLVVVTGQVAADRWPAIPTTGSRSGTVLKVDSALLKDVPATDSVATVLVVAVLFDSANKVQDTAYMRWTIRVPYVAPKPVAPKAPSISVNDNALPPELSVGAAILVKADSASKLAYTADGTAPACDKASGSSATIKVDSAMAGKTLVIRALSCRDALASTETKDSARIAKLDEVVKEKIAVPAAYQWNNPTARNVWTENVTISISPKSALVWNLRVLPSAAAVDESSWKAVGIPDTSSKSGAGTVVQVAKDLLASMPAKDSVAIVLAVAVLYDSTKAVIDTARLRWSIVVPVTPKPRLAVTRTPDKLVFSWPVTSSTADARAWYLLGTDTVKVTSVDKGTATDSFVVSASKGARVKVGVVSISGVTGRTSELSVMDTMALLAPRMPGYSIANIDTVEGKVQIVLDEATLAEKNTVWMAGYAPDAISEVTEYSTAFVEGKCTFAVNAGRRDFGVRATRDGMNADSVTSLVVKRTKEASPGKVQGLKVSRKDSSTVVWSWTKSGTREYRVLLLRGASMQSHFDTVECLADDKKSVGGVDSFKVTGLANGAKVSLAVVALAGADSAGGNAEPSFSTTTTLVPPPTPQFTVVNSNTATGEVTVAIANWSKEVTNWYVNFDSTGGGKFSDTYTLLSTVARNFAVNGTVSVQVKASRDGYVKSAVKSVPVKNTNIVAPYPPGGISWTRATNSVTLGWTAAANHVYRLFWDISTSSSDIDTSAATTNKVSAPDNPFRFDLTQGQRVRIALQTVSAKDSTRPSALVHASQSTLAPIDPVGTITAKLTNPATRTVTFSWPIVNGAVKYRYSSNLENGIKETESNSLAFQYPAVGVQDVTISVQAENKDGVPSSWTNATLHIPQNRGSTNLADWSIWTTGTTLTIQGLASTSITGTAPDSVRIRLYNLAGGQQVWLIPYGELNSFRKEVVLKEQDMNSGKYEINAQFRWTSGTSKGDTTNYDYRSVSGWAGPTPTAFYQIEDGKMKVGIADGGLTNAARKGWTLRVLANYKGEWVDIVTNPDQTTYPNIVDGGFGHYPMGASQLKIYSDSGLNTSVERIVPILPEDSLSIGGRYYPIVYFGIKRWITRPMNTPTTAKLCADRTTSADCGTAGRLYTWLEATGLSAIPDSGDHEVQGVCPTGWRVPYASDIIALLQTIAPGWTWDTRDKYNFKYQLFSDAGFGFASSSYSYEGYVGSEIWSDFAGIWAATTGSGGNKQYTDHWHFQESYISAMGRPLTYLQNNQVFCVEK
jgi:uncharacterized protein (TIGR02145 family)